MLWGQEAKQKYLLENLDDVYRKVAYQYNLSDADFPNVEEFRGKLQKTAFANFPKADRVTLSILSDMLSVDIPQIFKNIAGVTSASEREKNNSRDEEEDGDQNLKAMMNFDLNTPQRQSDDDDGTSSIIFAVMFVFFAVAVAVALRGGYISEWLALAAVLAEKAKGVDVTPATAKGSGL